jgi:hypothetical protein
MRFTQLFGLLLVLILADLADRTLAAGWSPQFGETTTTTFPLVINASDDGSLGSAPAGYFIARTNAINYLQSHLSTTVPVTVNIGFGWGQVTLVGGGTSVLTGPGNGDGQSSSYIQFNGVPWASFYPAFAAVSLTANAQSALATLSPSAPPTGWIAAGPGGAVNLNYAQLKALGISPTVPQTHDGFVGFNSSGSQGNAWCFDNSGGVPAGQVDLMGIMIHEITEVLGRNADSAILDLWRYSSAHTRLTSQFSSGYFSIDDGVTNRGNYHDSSGDGGDWAQSGNVPASDPFISVTTAVTGTTLPVTANDLILMNVLGWQPCPTC